DNHDRAYPSTFAMAASITLADQRPRRRNTTRVSPGRKAAGQAIVWIASLGLAAIVLLQLLNDSGSIDAGFADWRPVLYAYAIWAVAFCVGRTMVRGERGKRALFVLPAVLFTVSMVVFPTLLGLYIAFSDWNLSSFEG